jgi:hypothetical protein
MKNLIAAEWYTYAEATLAGVPADSVQRTETRRAFYAGALAAYSQVMVNLTPGPDSQPADEQMLRDLDAELHAFGLAVKQGLA